MPFTKFPSLESFGHVWRNKSSMMGGPVQTYRAKIKLHGTNAAIRIENGEVYGQKRTSDVTPEQDNAGFANWLEPNKEVWARVECDDPVTFFGEWAGPGVQKGDAVSLIRRKMFFIFAVQLGDEMVTCPDLISELMPEDCPELDDVMVLPWTEHTYRIDFSDPTKADEIAEELTSIAEDIGTLDPFIANSFGVEGPGEGVVMVPVPMYGKTIPRDTYSAFTFKVKAARHGAKKAKAASRKVEIPAGAKEFVEMFVTEARCQQGLVEACEGVAEKTRTSNFLKWMGSDVKKESEVELQDSGLEWKQVAKLVNSTAARWFHEKCSRPLSEAA